MAANAPFDRHAGAGVLAHQRREAARELAFLGLRKGGNQHLGDREAKNPVAQELEPLV
jgi:hypothetical protein